MAEALALRVAERQIGCMVKDSVAAELAPTGTLRAGINHGNPVLATKNSSTGELAGIAVDLARELARRLALPISLVGFESAGQMVQALKSGAWDVAFLAVDPVRAAEIAFTAPYMEIEGTYLAPAGSSLTSMADVDRAGVRIGVSANSAYDLFLRRSIRHAELIRAGNPGAAFELLPAGKVDIVAGVRQALVKSAMGLPGSRVFTESFMSIRQAVGVPKGRDGGAHYVSSFVEEAKASGLVARAIANAGIDG